jgi:predicted phage terminase large subunit-like protein
MKIEDLDLLEALAIEEARKSFFAFRQFINPKLKYGWWQRLIAYELQQFFTDFIGGLRPKLIIQAPPQHGKSLLIIDFVAWLAGKDTSRRVIYTSFSERLGIRANLRLQRIYDSDKYKKIFPDTRINSSNTVAISSQYLRNREILEYVNTDGYFRNTTVCGSITGEGLDLGIIDDPIKGREQAQSDTIRDKTWDWLTDDFMTRFSDDAGLLCILTRWHIDDPIGRLQKQNPNIRVISHPAIAVQDDPHRKIGEPLFPEHKSLEFLISVKKLMSTMSWESLYQQNPLPEEGSIFKVSWIRRYNVLPDWANMRVHSWDTANKTDELNAPSVCTCWTYGNAGGYHLADLLSRRMDYPSLYRMVISMAERDNPDAILIEDKASGQSLIQDLREKTSLPIIAIEPHGDKIFRASEVSATFEAGRVILPEHASWLPEYEAEIFGFPNTAFKDQVDSTTQFLQWVKRSGITGEVHVVSASESSRSDW